MRWIRRCRRCGRLNRQPSLCARCAGISALEESLERGLAAEDHLRMLDVVNVDPTPPRRPPTAAPSSCPGPGSTGDGPSRPEGADGSAGPGGAAG